jgi:precorrin-6A/cobalt-precorrin-6A reductase
LTRILILGGTSEAVALAEALHADCPELEVITSLAGVTRNPVTGPGTLRTGGFGGADGLADYLLAESVDGLIDATHPFASSMAAHGESAATKIGIPRIKLVRPMWQRETGDHWIEVDDARSAAEVSKNLNPACVLITLGRRDLEPFLALTGLRLVARMIEEPENPLPPHATLLQARGPFSVADEHALMEEHAVDLLVTKAAGGNATQAKITAARERAIPVVMLRRPAMPQGPAASSVKEVMDWIADQR